jgi:uncharacterized protein YbjT (DUF2867 family)
MICITGASGTVGSEISRQLAAAKVPFRAAVNSAKSEKAARARGLQVVLVDYNRPETLRAAFAGCERIYLLGPSAVNQTQLELNGIAAAKAAGVKHVVKQSAMGAEQAGYAIGKIHLAAEKALEASGLQWTHLRPNGFMQNVVTFMGPTIRAESRFFTAAGDGRMSHVDVRDIAEVAVRALTGSGHEGQAYTLTGSEALSYDQLASELSSALKRPIRHVNLKPAELKGGMLAGGMPEPLADLMLDLERYILEGRTSAISPHVRQVTGHEPRRFADFARETAATGVWDAELQASR